MKKEFGLYIHIPFCRQKCFYCDFPSFAGREEKIDRYLQALEQEFALLRQRLYKKDNAGDTESKFAPRTIYIGGGTPTALNAHQLKKLLEIVQKYVAVAEAEEFTVEMNPGTVDREKLLLLQQLKRTNISSSASFNGFKI